METEAYMTLAEVKARQAALKDKVPLDQAIAEMMAIQTKLRRLIDRQVLKSQ